MPNALIINAQEMTFEPLGLYYYLPHEGLGLPQRNAGAVEKNRQESSTIQHCVYNHLHSKDRAKGDVFFNKR